MIILYPLRITGDHSTLHSSRQESPVIEQIDGLWCHMAKFDPDYELLPINSEYTYYHLSLDTGNPYQKFGILSETTSQHDFVRHGYTI